MILKRIFSLLLIACLFSLVIQAQELKIELKKVEPQFWWKNMHNPNLQLLVYGENIAYSRVSLDYAGVDLKEVISVENPNYLFLNLYIHFLKM